MRRREFSAGLGSAAAWPVLASVQPERMRRIGALLGWTDGGPMSHPWLDAFIQELAHLGWVDGRNVRIVRLAPPARPFPQRGGGVPGFAWPTHRPPAPRGASGRAWFASSCRSAAYTARRLRSAATSMVMRTPRAAEALTWRPWPRSARRSFDPGQNRNGLPRSLPWLGTPRSALRCLRGGVLCNVQGSRDSHLNGVAQVPTLPPGTLLNGAAKRWRQSDTQVIGSECVGHRSPGILRHGGFQNAPLWRELTLLLHVKRCMDAKKRREE